MDNNNSGRSQGRGGNEKRHFRGRGSRRGGPNRAERSDKYKRDSGDSNQFAANFRHEGFNSFSSNTMSATNEQFNLAGPPPLMGPNSMRPPYRQFTPPDPPPLLGTNRMRPPYRQFTPPGPPPSLGTNRMRSPYKQFTPPGPPPLLGSNNISPSYRQYSPEPLLGPNSLSPPHRQFTPSGDNIQFNRDSRANPIRGENPLYLSQQQNPNFKSANTRGDAKPRGNKPNRFQGGQRRGRGDFQSLDSPVGFNPKASPSISEFDKNLIGNVHLGSNQRRRYSREQDSFQNRNPNFLRSQASSLAGSTCSLNSDSRDFPVDFSHASSSNNDFDRNLTGNVPLVSDHFQNQVPNFSRSRASSLARSTCSLNSDKQDHQCRTENNSNQENKNFQGQNEGVRKKRQKRPPKLNKPREHFENQDPNFTRNRDRSLNRSNTSLNSDINNTHYNSENNNQQNKNFHGKNGSARGRNKRQNRKVHANERDQESSKGNESEFIEKTDLKLNVNLTVENLENIIQRDPEEIVQRLSEDTSLEIFDVGLEPKMLILVIKILGKVCIADPSGCKGDILRRASLPTFSDNIFNLLCDLPYTEDKDIWQHMESFYENVFTLYNTLSDFKPSAARIWLTHLLEVERSIKAVKKNLNIEIDPNLLILVRSLIEDLVDNPDEVVDHEHVQRTTKKNEEAYFPDPVGDFRTVSLFPRPEDVYGEQPFLYPNIVDGPYRSVEHYLDIHYKLLREDFMSPIRQAIRNYKKQCGTKDWYKRIDNVNIYRKVKFLHPKTVMDKVGFEVCFDVDNKVNRVNWEFSNRFMYGSLLLFTGDNFDTFFLATVANRNVKELEKKRVVVELKETSKNANSLLGKEFIMAESQAYFDPYFNVLNALKTFDRTNFPMAEYIVAVNTETKPPMYLSPDSVYSLTTPRNNFTFRVLNDLEWPTNDELGLDVSQYEAFKAALTNDIVVIQGPPGTGKTFLGLKIAQAFLRNFEIWNQSSSPILVVCFTNHALDQFLAGLLPFTSKLVRIGGKSKGTELDKFNIRERRREFSYYKKTNSNRDMRELNLKMSRVFAKIQTHQTNMQVLDDTNGVLSLKTLQLVMSNNNRDYFENDGHLMDWLMYGVSGAKMDNTVKITITADRGVVKEDPTVDPLVADAEDDRVKQAFFDSVELEKVPPSEDMVSIHFACNLRNIQNKIDECVGWLNSNRIRNRHELTKLNYTINNLGLILAHLRKELIEHKKHPGSDVEKERLFHGIHLDRYIASDRWKLYNTWVEILRNGLIVELGEREAEFRNYAFRYEQLRQSDDIQILRSSHVVGTTTTIAARLQPMFAALAPKIVIVEEAAEALEAHIIASLPQSCEHLVLIGDHKQLRPSVAEVRLARQYKLDISLFERMVVNGMACHTLTLQHRMRPEISRQLVPTIYPILLDDVSVHGRDHIRGMDKNVFFMTHNHFEEEVVEITSKRNSFEAAILVRLAKYLVLQGYKPQEITILGTYKGQMYHMKNETKKIDDFPKGIQITVVDNFQGEENKIILLSLVRSNSMKKIGFLEIENRVCVALSRARDGLYIIGNMDNLVASSEIWPQIKHSLVQQQAYGPSLKLRCEVHPEQLTTITSEKDFSKVSEGGCSLICGQPLQCGHFCKSMCHISKDYHQRYKCKDPCTKILCQDGHQCPKKCHMTCGLCQIPMRRQLLCGHFANVPCHQDFRLCECQEPVEVVVDACGHRVTVPCYTKYDPTCDQPCENRLDCGHSCDRVCHVDDDPEHVDYACLKPCARLNKDCSEDHKCQLVCYEECRPCPERVERELFCRHSAKVLCSVDLLTYNCKHKCERILTCGHGCAKKCCEQCEPCPTLVEKAVPGCGHTVMIACSQRPAKEICDGRCSVKLQCGHACTKRCKDVCSVNDCVEPKRFKITTMLCGHTDARIPCNESRGDRVHQMMIVCAESANKKAAVRSFFTNLRETFTNTEPQREYSSSEIFLSQEELMQYCVEECGQMLACNHKCSGSCSECMQGRIHKVCDQPCGNVLICGHSCPVPCREVCPPCNQPCKHRCKHSKCSRKCGEPCASCNEPCSYRCPHLQCTKRCGQLCDREPCYEPCPKELSCSHPCVGYCGEPCPPCRRCEPTHFEEFFYTGEETEDDSRWIYLEDCKHTFESSGLEYWLNMKQEGKEIVAKSCPRCKTSIVTVQRFMNLIKATYKDIQNVKSQCFGKTEEITRQRLQSLRKLQDVQFEQGMTTENEPDGLEKLHKTLRHELPEVRNKKRGKTKNVLDIQKVRLLCFLTEFFISLYERKREAWHELNDEAKRLLTKKINLLTRLLDKRQQKISEQEMQSFELEVRRIHRLCDLLRYKSSPNYIMSSSYSGAKDTMKKAEEIILGVQIYDDVRETLVKALLVKLKEQIKSTTEVTSEERAMINKAMGSSFHSSQKSGHWFKCKNGHVYCITECGGAMEEAMCPVRGCGARIGGQQHTLRPDQNLASEMDGARYAAWSDQNNMANFRFF